MVLTAGALPAPRSQASFEPPEVTWGSGMPAKLRPTVCVRRRSVVLVQQGLRGGLGDGGGEGVPAGQALHSGRRP